MKIAAIAKCLARTSCCLVALSLVSTQASALNQYQYKSTLTGGNYAAQASYGGVATPTVVLDKASASASGMSQLVNAAGYFYQSIDNQIDSGLMQYFAGITQSTVVLAYPGAMTGNATATISGLPDGNLQFDLGGLVYRATVMSHGSGYSCTTNLTMTDIRISARFNPRTGVVADPKMYNGVITATQCSTAFSWIPGIGNALDKAAAGAVNAAAGAIAAPDGRLLAIDPNAALFGFVGAITANSYKLGNVDVGMFLKNNIAGLYTGSRITLGIGDIHAIYAPTIKNTAGPSQYSNVAFSVDFNDNGRPIAGFKVIETNYFTWTQMIPEDMVPY